jgi:hypothetical protein
MRADLERFSPSLSRSLAAAGVYNETAAAEGEQLHLLF